MNSIIKPLAWEQDGNDWVAKSLAGPFRISKNTFGNWTLAWLGEVEQHWDLDILKDTAARAYAAHVHGFLHEPGKNPRTFTLVFNRESTWDDRGRTYYPSEFDLFVARDLDEAIAKALEVEIANIEDTRNYYSLERTLLIDGLREDDVWWVYDEDEDAREQAVAAFKKFDTELAVKLRDYKDGEAERKRKKEEEDRRKADAARIAAARDTEQRERKMLEELQKKYPTT